MASKLRIDSSHKAERLQFSDFNGQNQIMSLP